VAAELECWSSHSGTDAAVVAPAASKGQHTPWHHGRRRRQVAFDADGEVASGVTGAAAVTAAAARRSPPAVSL